MNRHIETYIHGTLQGRIWWPQVICHKDVHVNLTREGARYSDGRPDFRTLVNMRVCNDGDFQSASLTDDSALLVILNRGSRVIKRYFPITMFPSIADMVEERNYEDEVDADD